jgi:diguanylate cyclase (GGDEF)-like protein
VLTDMTKLNFFKTHWRAMLRWPMVGLLMVAPICAVTLLERGCRHAVLAVAGAMLLVCALLSVISMRAALHRHRAETVRLAYRTASEGTSDGFFIAVALRDGGGEIIDFEVADCNQAGADLFGVSRAQLIGRRLQDSPGPYWRTTFDDYKSAMASGYAEQEIELPELAAENPLRAQWIRRRLVRTGAALAVTVQDISRSKAHQQDLFRLTNEDALTGLPNRRWLNGFLPGAIVRAREGGSMLAVLVVDLDGFKEINDSSGHAAGDRLLRETAQRLRSLLRGNDRVAHLGADEFVLILKRADSEQQAERLAERIGAALAQPFAFGGGSERISASVGISLFPRDGDDSGALLKNADIAMQAVKLAGKAQHRFYQPALYEGIRSRRALEHSLALALAQDQFVIVYQPRTDAVSGQLCGMEALVRWMHPQRGLVGPLEFISVAEGCGLIVELGVMVIDKVCRQMAAWQVAGLALVPVSVNVSAHQFERGDLHDVLQTAMARHGVAPQHIEIEITESAMMGEPAAAQRQLAALRAQGVRLLVDDFGTGYSSLSQLQKFPLDGLKIDRAFTMELGRSEQGAIFVRAIISMAHALGMRVVAEGVETAEQAGLLRALDCDELQGYLIARPLAPAAMEALLRNAATLLP